MSQVNKVNYKVKMLDNPDGIDTYHVEKFKPSFGALQLFPKGEGV